LTGPAEGALWLALLAAAFGTGVGVSRWGAPAPARDLDAARLIAGALGVLGVGLLAGDLLRGAPSTFLGDLPPMPLAPGYRVAPLWASPKGAAATLSAVLLVLAALGPGTGRRLHPAISGRVATVLSGMAAACLVVALLAGGGPQAPRAVPVWAQSAWATVAPLAALGALAALLQLVALAIATRGEPLGTAAYRAWQGPALGAAMFATISLGAEQASRGMLGIGPRDPIVLGSAASGLVLWVVSMVVLHRRVASVALSAVLPASDRASSWPTRLAHVGAASLVLSFVAHVFAARSTVDLPPGTPVEVADALGGSWRMVNQGVSRFDHDGSDITAVAIEATGPDGRARLITSEQREVRSFLGGNLEPIGIRGSTGTPLQRVRVLLESADPLDTVRVRVAFVPLLVLWPAGLLLLAAAGVLHLLVPWAARSASFRSP